MANRKPFDFVHNTRLKYFRFYTCDWFYNDPGYSEEFVKRNSYSFDGQIFFKQRLINNGITPDKDK